MRRLFVILVLIAFLLATIGTCTVKSQSPEAVGELKVVITYDPDEDGFYQAVGEGYQINLYDLSTGRIVDEKLTGQDGSYTFPLFYGPYRMSSALGYADLTRIWVCNGSEILDQPKETVYVRCEKRPVLELLFPFLSNFE